MVSICSASALARATFGRKQIPEPLGTCSCLGHDHNCKYVSSLLNHSCPAGTKKTISIKGILTFSWTPYPFLTINPSSHCLPSSRFGELLAFSSLQAPVCHLNKSKTYYSIERNARIGQLSQGNTLQNFDRLVNSVLCRSISTSIFNSVLYRSISTSIFSYTLTSKGKTSQIISFLQTQISAKILQFIETPL